MGNRQAKDALAETTYLGSSEKQIIQSFVVSEEDTDNGGIPLLLTATQSCKLHGWTNPRRLLTWSDIQNNPAITFQRCLQAGISAEQLHHLQPDAERWVQASKVTMQDVPHMLAWPLHPVQHFRADISDLTLLRKATARLEPVVLMRLKIDYAYLRRELLMDDDWMHMLKYRPCDWHRYLRFSEQDAQDMGNMRVFKVFGMDLCMLKLALSSVYMASVSVLNPPWKDEYPEFHEMIIKGLGELQHVDEFDVPFWGAERHVLIKQHHPLFRKEAQDALLKKAQQGLEEQHLQTIQETLDLFNSRRESWQNASSDEEWRVALAKQPILVPKDLYNRFKISCRAVSAFGELSTELESAS